MVKIYSDSNSYDNNAEHIQIGCYDKQDYRDNDGNQQLHEADFNNQTINDIMKNYACYDDDISVSGHEVQTSYRDDDNYERRPDVYYKSAQGRFIVIGETKATRDDLRDCTLTKNNQNHLKCQLNAYVNELVNNNDYNDYEKEIILAVPFEELSEALQLVDSFTDDPNKTYKEYCFELGIKFRIITEVTGSILSKPDGFIADDNDVIVHENIMIGDNKVASCDVMTVDIMNPDNGFELVFDDNNVRTTSITYDNAYNVSQDDLFYALLSEKNECAF